MTTTPQATASTAVKYVGAAHARLSQALDHFDPHAQQSRPDRDDILARVADLQDQVRVIDCAINGGPALSAPASPTATLLPVSQSQMAASLADVQVALDRAIIILTDQTSSLTDSTADTVDKHACAVRTALYRIRTLTANRDEADTLELDPTVCE